ncbi:MAG: glycosyltransferase [Thermoplasmata archaeon]|nr:glycosyltransferase [Thermoplasmata archaeon]
MSEAPEPPARTSKTVVWVSTFPPEHCGVGDYMSRILVRNPGKRPWLVAANRVAGAPNVAPPVFRIWTKGDLAYPAEISLRIREIASPKSSIVYVRHHFLLYGGLWTNAIFPLVLWSLRLQGYTVVTELNSVIDPAQVQQVVGEVNPRIPVSMAREGLRWLYRIAGRSSHSIVVLTEPMKRVLCETYGVPEAKVTVLPVAATLFDPPPKSEARTRLGLDHQFVIVFHGFLDPTKGLEELLRAFATLLPTLPEARLVIVGEESPVLSASRRGYTSELRGLADRLGISARTLFTGYLEEDQMVAYLASADVFALPTSSSSIVAGSGVLGKVAGFGTPLITSRTPRFTEALHDGTSAIFVTPGDAAELASALVRIARDAPLAARLGAGARAFAESRSWGAIVAQTEEYFGRLDGSAG